MLLRVAWLGIIVVSLGACSTPRKILPVPWSSYRATLNAQQVLVREFPNIRRVQQSRQDHCWAASLEQALAHQGVDTDQERIADEVYPKIDPNLDQTLNMFWWEQMLSILEEHLNDGSKVWVRTDIDGWQGGSPILSIRTFVSKIARELDAFRMPLIGISTEPGRGHIETVIGFAMPIEVKKITSPPDQLVGFVIYDPFTGKSQLVSTEQLFEQFVALVYVTTYDSAAAAIMGVNSSTKNVW
jgi:hypothetical protein